MNKWNYNLQVFYNEDDISYYLLGVWAADGCIYARKNRPNTKIATLTSKDKDWLEIINNYICPNKPLLIKNNCFILMCNSTELGDWFINHGIGERKSLTLKMPNIPNAYLLDFIRGCWDGDGSLSFTKSGNKGKNYQRQANLTSGSLLFCQSLSKILHTLKIKNKIYPHGNNERKIEGRTIQPSQNWRIVISGGESVYNLCKLLYNNTSISMPRKYKISQDIISNWEAPSICIDCNTIIQIKHRAARRLIRCQECNRLFKNKRARLKYKTIHL